MGAESHRPPAGSLVPRTDPLGSGRKHFYDGGIVRNLRHPFRFGWRGVFAPRDDKRHKLSGYGDSLPPLVPAAGALGPVEAGRPPPGNMILLPG